MNAVKPRRLLDVQGWTGDPDYLEWIAEEEKAGKGVDPYIK